MTKENLNTPLFPNLECEMVLQGINQRLLGEMIGKTPNQISVRLAGKVEFSLEDAMAISKVLGKSINYLFQRA